MSVFFLYLPFGETMAQQNAAGWETPYKFTGKELDDVTGLYYFGARYYDPHISLWMSVDPLAEKYPGISSYSYVGNNPLNSIDIHGDSITPISSVKYSGYFLNRENGIKAGTYTLYGGTTDGNKPVWVASTITVSGSRDDYVMDIGDVKEFRKNSTKFLYQANMHDAAIAFGGNKNGDYWQAWKDCWTPSTVLGGIAMSLGGALSSGSRINSVNQIMDNPSIVEGRSLKNVKSSVQGSNGWINSKMSRTRGTDKGWVFRQVNSKNQETGKLIQYHPGSQRHFNGNPYWKVSDGVNKYRFQAKK